MTTIPRITQGTVYSVTTSMEHDENYFENFVAQIKKENRLVYELISIIYQSSLVSENKVAAEAYMRGACTVYKLIESQMEGDEMDRVWGIKK